MRFERNLWARFACASVLAWLPPAYADDSPCLKCHAEIVNKMAAHKKCEDCHVGLDASVEPHKTNGKTAKQLAAEGSSLCVNCHEQKLFKGKVVHAPVEEGKCLVCHDPHASDHLGLLKMDPATLCLDCHPDIKKGPHVIAGFSRAGHPLGNDKKEAQDPLRPGKKFYCAACHEPHRSELPKLSRFVSKGMVSCQKCHKM